MIKMHDLKHYAKEGLNVLMTGKHGVGKTAMVKEVFNEVFGEHGKNWKYFSASTLDPWVDFIGIPKNYTRADGKEVFGIVPPENFTGEEEIQAIFFDEINRAETKTLNALMELIQFKSINGRKFPNLKCIWGAENPSDEEYSVQKLDPAQKDRFQIQLLIPEELNKNYFIEKYGKEAFEISNVWWDKHKEKISPRKLDDILSGYMRGFNINHFTTSVNVAELAKSLKSVSEISRIKYILNSGSPSEIKDYFSLSYLRSNEKIIETFLEKEYREKLYEHTSGEVKAYVKEVFIIDENLSTDQENLLSGGSVIMMKDDKQGASKFIEFLQKYEESFGSNYNPNVKDRIFIKEYMKNIFKFNFNGYTTNDYNNLCFEMVTFQNISYIDTFRNLIADILYVNSYYENKEVIKQLVQIVSNQDIIKLLSLNKIAFEEYVKTAKDQDIQEMKIRLKA